MGSERILIDTSILIDYFRKKNIEKTLFYQLADKYDFSISVITEFEFLIGFSDDKVAFAKEIIKNMEIIEIDTGISEKARHLYFNSPYAFPSQEGNGSWVKKKIAQQINLFKILK